MGAPKSAGIKLTLQAQGFANGIKKEEDNVKKSGSRMGASLKSALSDGLKAGLDSLKSTISTIKSTVLSIGGIASGIGVVDLIRGSVTAEAGFRKLAFAIRAGTGEAVSFRQIQTDVQRVALKTGQAAEQLGSVIEGVFSETGDAAFARNTIETIAIAANGAHEPLATIGNLAGTLNEKFGVTEETLGATLAQLIGLGNKGGVSVGELGEQLGVVGAYAKAAGLEGEAGLSKIVGMLNVADDSGKNFKKNIRTVGTLIEQMGTGGMKAKLGAQLGIDPKKLKGDAAAAIGEILKATGGKKEKLAGVFQGDQLEFLVELGKSYAQSFEETKGSVKQKTEAASAAFASALQDAGKSALTWDDLQKEAASEMESTDKKFAVALEKLKATFSKPEITAAVNKLADNLPKLADMVESVISFAVANPALAAGAGVGAMAGQAAIGAATQSLFSQLIGAAFAKGGTTAAASVAEGMAGQAATTAGGSVAKGFIGALSGGTGVAVVGAAIAAAFVVASMAGVEEQKDKEKAAAAESGDKFYDGGGGGTGAGNAEGMGNSGQNYEKFVDPTTGKEEIIPIDSLEREKFMTEVLPNGKTREEMQGEAQAFMAPPSNDELVGAAQAFMAPDPSWKKPQGTAKADSGIDAKLLAEMLGAKELRVKITNPEEMRGPGAGGTGSPTPGNVPRK